MGYRLVRWLARLLLAVFYRRVAYIGVGKVPLRGPLVVCANHHGALVDPMVLVAGLPRIMRPLAKATLFQHPLIRPFLKRIGAIPVFRPQDQKEAPGDNAGMFRAANDVLAAGGAILVFPEGISKAEQTLSPLRPGAARMALEAEALHGWTLGVVLLPVGILWDEAAWFRRGKIVVQVGEPIAAGAFRDPYERDREEGTRPLLDRLESALRELVVEMESAEDLRLVRVAVRAWSQERGERLDDAAAASLARAFASAYRETARTTPGKALRLRATVEAYARTLEHFQLRGGEIDLRYTPAGVLTFLLREGVTLLIGTPLGLAGAVANWIPYRATFFLAGRQSDAEDAWASFKLAASVVLFPAYWIAVFAAVWAAASLGWALVWGVFAPVSGLWALRFRELRQSFSQQVRAFFLLAGGAGLKRHLQSSRRAIHDEVEALRASL